jgi:phage terminase large subunit-like protein
MQLQPSTGPRKRKKRPSRADVVIKWVEDNCFVAEGKLLGQPVVLADWQKVEIRRIYDGHARRAILSFGRKNGKTALASYLMLVHLVGPLMVINSQLYSTAQSREQAALIYHFAAKTVRMSPALSPFVTIRDAAKELFCPEIGTRYRALSAEVKTSFGLSPVFVVHDELGQVRGPRSELYDALETATGAQEDPLTLIISTQAPTDNDLLSILIDDAMTGLDPRTIVSLYTAPMELDPFSPETIKLANPALGNFLNEVEVYAMAEDARRMPTREAEFRNLVLNQRVESSNPFVAPGVWAACGKAPVPDLRGKRVYGGLDLSEAHDLTALVLISDVGGVWHVAPTFWLPSEGLREKSRTDRIPYDLWRDQGFLEATPGKSISYEYVATRLKEIFGAYDVVKIGFDRWNMKHLKPWLEKAGLPEQYVDEKFVEFGQGTQSMSPALRDLESLILDEKISHGMHPVLQMCAVNAVVEGKDSANRKLSKNKSRGRIDGMVALAMAVGVAPGRQLPFDAAAWIG